MKGRKRLQFVGSVLLGSSGVLLLTPVRKAEALWAVTVGTEMAGFVPVGTESTRLIQGAFSQGQMLGASDRARLAVAFAFLGLSAGIGLMLVLTREA